ncbi:PREDICTED: early boundary activity protein 2-like [Bactrocera latifrons]|uniref:early boundary activity protein 2-like n=1 Tax=Bactrocera latifrons TaxID=174628 RepID=UPI0008DE83E5|nr:PREDICTED: early boundary activity protein 2-like [Bactrocera latifrons]
MRSLLATKTLKRGSKISFSKYRIYKKSFMGQILHKISNTLLPSTLFTTCLKRRRNLQNKGNAAKRQRISYDEPLNSVYVTHSNVINITPEIIRPSKHIYIDNAKPNTNEEEISHKTRTELITVFKKEPEETAVHITPKIENHQIKQEITAETSNYEQVKEEVTNTEDQLIIDETIEHANERDREQLSDECSTEITDDFSSSNVTEKETDEDSHMIKLGPNGTAIPKARYDKIRWSSSSFATRKLLMCVFGGETLATHSFSGRIAPLYYKHKDTKKPRLDPEKVADIIYCVQKRFQCSEKTIRAAISSKCGDEAKRSKV